MLILLTGCVLLRVGVARLLDLSALIASLAVGATMANLSANSRKLLDALSRTEPPLYAIFFVIAGADLNLSLLKSIGILGVLYVAGRAAGKLGGSRVAMLRGRSMHVSRYLGPSILAHAGLAVGLTLSIRRRFPDFAPPVIAVVLAGIAIYEMIGPVTRRRPSPIDGLAPVAAELRFYFVTVNSVPDIMPMTSPRAV